MRKAAGILLMVMGMFLLISFATVLIDYGRYHLAFDLFVIIAIAIASVFIIAGGVVCLMRKVWGLCFASAVVAWLFMILWSMGAPFAETWLTWLFSIVGILPIIFIWFTQEEWKAIQG